MCEFEEHDLDDRIKQALETADMYLKESNNCARLMLAWIEEANELINRRDVMV